MGTADRPPSAAVSVATARSRRAETGAAWRRTMRCKAEVDAACAASVVGRHESGATRNGIGRVVASHERENRKVKFVEGVRVKKKM